MHNQHIYFMRVPGNSGTGKPSYHFYDNGGGVFLCFHVQFDFCYLTKLDPYFRDQLGDFMNYVMLSMRTNLCGLAL